MLRVLASVALWGLVADLDNHVRAADPGPVDPPPTGTVVQGNDRYPDNEVESADAVVPKPRPVRPYVGTVDLTRAFAEHIRFKVRSEELRVKMAAVEAEHSVERPKVSVETQKTEFAQMEANLYRETLADVQFAVAAQAEARGMRLVLRVDPQTVTDDPLTIVKAINQFILHQEGIDLTDAVIATVNGKPTKADVVALPAPLVDEAPPSAFPVATLDLGRVFAEDLMFKRLNDDMKRDVERAENELKSMRVGLVRESDELGKLTEGSQAYLEKDAAIRRSSADLQSQIDKRKEQFALDEAKNYYGILLGIRGEMQRLADSKGFALVLRTSDMGELSIDPKELVQSKLVVYQKGIDITNDVIAARNAKHSTVKE